MLAEILNIAIKYYLTGGLFLKYYDAIIHISGNNLANHLECGLPPACVSDKISVCMVSLQMWQISLQTLLVKSI